MQPILYVVLTNSFFIIQNLTTTTSHVARHFFFFASCQYITYIYMVRFIQFSSVQGNNSKETKPSNLYLQGILTPSLAHSLGRRLRRRSTFQFRRFCVCNKRQYILQSRQQHRKHKSPNQHHRRYLHQLSIKPRRHGGQQPPPHPLPHPLPHHQPHKGDGQRPTNG